MALFRRKPLDAEIADAKVAFRRVAAELDAAQRALLAAVPTARHSAVPLSDALSDFLAGLARADALMPAWRTAKTEAVWIRCAEALGQSHAAAERLRDNAEPTLGFEELNARLGDIIAVLEEFADAAAAIRRVH